MFDRNRSRNSAADTGNPNLRERVGGHIQSRVVSGILELLPIIVPLVVIVYVVNLADSAVVPMLDAAVGRLSGGRLVVPNIWGVGLVMAAMVFYLVGVLCSTGPGRSIVAGLTGTMSRIPVVNGIAGVTRQVTTLVASEYNFSRVVFLEWPREDMVALGFVTARISKPGTGESLAIVYIPTVPNPTSGNMALVSEDDLYETDMSVEAAMKLVFSGGIVPPDAIGLARMPVEYRVHSSPTGRFVKEAPDRSSNS